MARKTSNKFDNLVSRAGYAYNGASDDYTVSHPSLPRSCRVTTARGITTVYCLFNGREQYRVVRLFDSDHVRVAIEFHLIVATNVEQSGNA